MISDDSQKEQQGPPPNAIASDGMMDDIVSVNDRGRRQSGRLGPFLTLGGVALVVMIGALATLNVVKAKFSGPKHPPAAATASAAGLARTFDTETAPALPGASAASPVAASPACPDGSAGNELRGQDGIVVRNAAGQSVRVCPNGQVLAAMTAQPIPVQRTTQRPVGISGARGAAARPMRAPDGPMMLNGGRYGGAPLQQALNDPQAALGAVQQATGSAQPKAEGLLTGPAAGTLEAELTPSKTPMVQAARIENLNLLLPKGRTIDCGMSMRIISSLAGEASCVVTQNVYSANGKVVLIERGSEAVGEYRSGASIGQKRLFVLWNRIITPGGVVINLDSPGADELGSTGLTGKVDSHWFERVGSAFLLSTVQDAIQYEVAQAQTGSGATLVLGNTAQAGDTMAQKVLNASINIPPTIYKNQGDRAVIYVARDLDFSNVYRLRAQQ
ncbi:MAG: type IV secretion system protein VirB10 [Asticcacaulis sp.]|uniref:type IV secretion system protein VirB10 n=1 Tax=Asticcacaulis sp. TaxID=1872648 RepID=UPI003F7BA4C6